MSSLDAANCWTFSTGIPKSHKRTCIVFGLPSAYTFATCSVLLQQGCDIVVVGPNVSNPKFMAMLQGKASHGQTIVHHDLQSYSFQLSDAHALNDKLVQSSISTPMIAFTICNFSMHQTLLSDPLLASTLNLSRIVSIFSAAVPTPPHPQSATSTAASINEYNPRSQLSLLPHAVAALARMHIPAQVGRASVGVIQVNVPASELVLDAGVHPMMDHSSASEFAEAVALAVEGVDARWVVKRAVGLSEQLQAHL